VLGIVDEGGGVHPHWRLPTRRMVFAITQIPMDDVQTIDDDVHIRSSSYFLLAPDSLQNDDRVGRTRITSLDKFKGDPAALGNAHIVAHHLTILMPCASRKTKRIRRFSTRLAISPLATLSSYVGLLVFIRHLLI
jgi:hypothetical protein